MKLTTNTSNILNNLSFSELNGIKAIAERLEGSQEKLVIISEVADEHKITRSVCTNALRIIEACGVIVTKSLGMKGLHIKVLNQEAFDDSVEIIDIKGMITKEFAIKRKMFERQYLYTLKLLTYKKKYGWIELEEYNKLKKVAK